MEMRERKPLSRTPSGNPEFAKEVTNLIKTLQHEAKSLRGRGIHSLLRLGDAAKETIPSLIKALKDVGVRMKTEGGIGDPKAMLALTEALKDRNEVVRMIAAVTLKEIGAPAKEVLPALIKASQEKYAPVRMRAAAALAVIGGSEAIPALIKALKDKDTHVRMRTAQLLGEIGDSAAVPALIEALQDADAEVREDAAVALGQIHTPEARQAVEAHKRLQ